MSVIGQYQQNFSKKKKKNGNLFKTRLPHGYCLSSEVATRTGSKRAVKRLKENMKDDAVYLTTFFSKSGSSQNATTSCVAFTDVLCV